MALLCLRASICARGPDGSHGATVSNGGHGFNGPLQFHLESNMTDVLLGLKAHVPITTLESLRAGGNNASSAPYGSLVYRFYGFYG